MFCVIVSEDEEEERCVQEACVRREKGLKIRVLGSTRKIVKKLCYSQSVVNLRENETKAGKIVGQEEGKRVPEDLISG